MRTFILNIFMVLVLLMPAAAMAQQAAKPAEPAPAAEQTETAKDSVNVNQDDLKKLITTLESETGRNDFIQNLKTLQASQEKGTEETTEEKLAPLTETLGVDSFASSAIRQYEGFLSRNDLKGSTVGKIALSVIVLFAGIGLNFFFRRIVTRGLYWADRAVTWLDLPAMRLRLYGRILRTVVSIGIALLLIYAWCLVWELQTFNPFNQEWFTHGLRVAMNVFFVVMLATLAWESVNAVVHLVFVRVGGKDSARASTILPIVRNVLFIVFAVLFALVVLSEIGINIVPLLAGAGIVGIAIGFGAQTMVKDFLTGFTLILEDVMRVGDVVNIAGMGGVVEKITLRKVQLRSYNGTVYTIPFSDITIIQNLSKEFSFYEFNIGVAYKEDTDHVADIMRAVGEDLQADPEFGPMMIDAIEIAGVDAFADSAVKIKGRLKTYPLKQWSVGREFNRRLKKAFDKEGIEIPFPQQVTWNRNPPVTVVERAKDHTADKEG